MVLRCRHYCCEDCRCFFSMCFSPFYRYRFAFFLNEMGIIAGSVFIHTFIICAYVCTHRWNPVPLWMEEFFDSVYYICNNCYQVKYHARTENKCNGFPFPFLDFSYSVCKNTNSLNCERSNCIRFNDKRRKMGSIGKEKSAKCPNSSTL